MEGVLDTDHWRVANLVDRLQVAADIECDLKIISMLGLQPERVFKNQDNQEYKFVFRWGDITGIGDTVIEAVGDFNTNYYNLNRKA